MREGHSTESFKNFIQISVEEKTRFILYCISLKANDILGW